MLKFVNKRRLIETSFIEPEAEGFYRFADEDRSRHGNPLGFRDYNHNNSVSQKEMKAIFV